MRWSELGSAVALLLPCQYFFVRSGLLYCLNVIYKPYLNQMLLRIFCCFIGLLIKVTWNSISLMFHFFLADICLRNPTSLADSWHNIQLCLNFCNKILLPALPANLQSTVSSSVLRPEDFLYSGTVLNANMISFLGNLYYYLETEGLQDVVRPLGESSGFSFDN